MTELLIKPSNHKTCIRRWTSYW